jgi:hypothetical protein
MYNELAVLAIFPWNPLSAMPLASCGRVVMHLQGFLYSVSKTVTYPSLTPSRVTGTYPSTQTPGYQWSHRRGALRARSVDIADSFICDQSTY